MENKTEFQLSFGGFYQSIHSDVIDKAILFDTEESPESGINFDTVNFRTTYANYARELLSEINSELNTDMQFVNLDSPRYYNYSTDTITTLISDSDIKKVLSQLYDEDAKEWIAENCKSSSGFVSFYPTLQDVKKDVTVLLQYLFKYYESEKDFTEFNLHEIAVNSITTQS